MRKLSAWGFAWISDRSDVLDSIEPDTSLITHLALAESELRATASCDSCAGIEQVLSRRAVPTDSIDLIAMSGQNHHRLHPAGGYD